MQPDICPLESSRWGLRLRYDPDATIEAAEWVRVNGDGSAPVQVDGEIFGSRPVEIALNSPRPRLIVSTSKVDS